LFSASTAPVPSSSLDRATHSLERSRQIVADTELIGAHVANDLEGQREKLIAGQHHVRSMSAATRTVRKTLRTMSSNALTLKVFLVVVNVLLAALIGMLVYYGYIKGKLAG
jgi:hypothetical protein